jgi:2-amino-4-hydroxy-6-hydroxymethyldihydropteridine diphosphokinase
MYSNNHHFLIALGSNKKLGLHKPLDILNKAIAELKQSEISLVSLSRFFESPAYPEGKGSNFVNSVIKIQVKCAPEEILQKLHKIEKKFNRKRDTRWGARTLDLDLLAQEGQVVPNEEIFREWYNLPLVEQMKKSPKNLILPHPRIQDRAFVLLPLLDIEPNWIHPILRKTAFQMYEELNEQVKKSIQLVQ